MKNLPSTIPTMTREQFNDITDLTSPHPSQATNTTKSPFETWQECYPNQIRIKLSQSDLHTLSDIGFNASFVAYEIINQFVLREYFTGEIFTQLGELRRAGSYTKRNVYFKISTALALLIFSEENSHWEFLKMFAKEIKSALAKQVSIKL